MCEVSHFDVFATAFAALYSDETFAVSSINSSLSLYSCVV